ncbi:MAG: hypothetical protein NC395_11675 [Prevotella sp.]|nr:hypothetical protein [Prevotella sp.]
MNLRKLRKTAVSILAAAVSAALIMSVSVSAAEKTDVWKETKTMAGATYSSKYTKLIKKYYEKDSDKTVSFGKSRTKKFFDKYNAAREEDKPLSYSVTGSDVIMSMTYDSEHMKVVSFMEDLTFGLYIDTEKLSLIDPETKTKCSIEIEKDDFSELAASASDSLVFLDGVRDELGFDDDYSENGKYFKLKSNDKIYFYEEFSGGGYNFGFLFSEKGKLLAMGDDSAAFCVNVSYSVDSDDFKIPAGYKDVGILDFDSDLFN